MYEFSPELVSRMKTVAKEHTIFVGESIMASNPCLWKAIQYNNEEINLILTYEVLEKTKFDAKIWHLSLIRSDESEVAQQIANEIASDILGENAQQIPPESLPPQFRFMKQFVLKAD